MTDLFKWRHYESEIILTWVRWYLRYALPYRDLEEMMTERGLSVDDSTIFRWVQRYSPELDMRCRPHFKQTNDSRRVDETIVKVRGKWMVSVPSCGFDWTDNRLSSERDPKHQSR